jgi:beta-glucanase (GH16 family)
MEPLTQFPHKYLIYIFITLLSVSGCAPKSEWELVWAEEFEYSGSPSGESWGYELGHIRNNELQYYSNSPKNVSVGEGNCTIIARLASEDSITSASINTLGRVDFLYGRIEVRARIPSALGTWPAIWMLGTNRMDMGWPQCGEIDIMENVGYDPDQIHANIHTGSYNHSIGTNKGNQIYVKDPQNDFHLYSVEWFEDHMDFFFDDSLYFSFQNDLTGNNDTWPFDKPHYLLLNLAYGGSWGGNEGVAPDLLPLRFDIDYVRYYKRKSLTSKSPS